MQPLRHITVIGGGSWATALVKIFSESDITVYWYLRSQQQVDYLLENGRNCNYLSFLQLDLQKIRPTCKLEEALDATEDILFAMPSAHLESEIAELEENCLVTKQVYVSIKGIIPDHDCTPSVFLHRRFRFPIQNIIVLAGPCHAEEIAMGLKTFLTVSGNDRESVTRMASSIRSTYLNVISNEDPTGVEYAAILKNVIAIAGGVIKGMNYGDKIARQLDVTIPVVAATYRNLYKQASPYNEFKLLENSLR